MDTTAEIILHNLAEEYVRKGLSFDQYLNAYWPVHKVRDMLYDERNFLHTIVDIYFDEKDEYEDLVGEMAEGLQERISDLTAYIDFIRLKGGKRFTQQMIDKILTDNDLKIIDKDSGA